MGPFVLAGACAALVVGLLVAIGRGSRWRIPAKLLASACFVAIPVAGGAGFDSSYVRLVVVGLVFGAVGDGALLGTSKRAFLAGLVAFLIGHVAYIAAFAASDPAAFANAIGLALGASFAAVGIAGFARRAGKLALPVAVYSLVIGAMVAAAWPLSGRLGDLARVGAILFAISDLFVARQRFVAAAFSNRLIGLPLYYAGQLLIAWSTLAG